jgi:starch phosphorylase
MATKSRYHLIIHLEAPDFWLDKGNPWEIERLDVVYPIKFYGRVLKRKEQGKDKSVWEAGVLFHY